MPTPKPPVQAASGRVARPRLSRHDPPTIISDPEALHDLVATAQGYDRIAIDTEFVWERTYYPKLGLIQLGLPEGECYLLDIPALGDLQVLGRILENPDMQIVLHDPPQDLSILRRVTGAYPRSVFDTRCAAGFVGLPSTLSLSDLLKELLNINLSKTASRTNWLQRPLTNEQLEYAAGDVRYLLEASDELVHRACKRGLEGWMQEEMRTFDECSIYDERNGREQFLRIKGIQRCRPRELAVLRELADWREREARRADRPRSHIIGDQMLVHLARFKPKSLDSLSEFYGLAERKIRKHGKELVAAVTSGLQADSCPQLPPRPRDPRARKRQIDALLEHVRQRGEVVGVDPRLVTSRAELKELFGAGENALVGRMMKGWRKEFLGDLSGLDAFERAP